MPNMVAFSGGSAITPIQDILNNWPVRTFKPANIAALNVLTGMTSGDIAIPTLGQAVFVYNGTAWVQKTDAVYGSLATGTADYAATTGLRTTNSYMLIGDARYRWSGSAWKIWDMPTASYTPTVSGITIGAGQITGRYSVTGGVATFSVMINWSATSVMASGLPGINIPSALPAPVLVSGGGTASGNVTVYYLDSGATYYGGIGILTASGLLFGGFTATGSINPLSPTVPMTWANGDTIHISATYTPA